LKIKQRQTKNPKIFLKASKTCDSNGLLSKVKLNDSQYRRKSELKLREIESAKAVLIQFFGEFDPGSGRTLAACLTHASRTGPDVRQRTSEDRLQMAEYRLQKRAWRKPSLDSNILSLSISI